MIFIILESYFCKFEEKKIQKYHYVISEVSYLAD